MVNVLICDDIKFMRKVLSDIVESMGWKVIGEAENGEDAIEKYEKLKPDIVSLDMVMPKMNGMDVIKKILSTHPNAKIVSVSAISTQEAIIEEAIKAGAKAYVTKPVRKEILIDKLKKAYYGR